MPNTTSASEEPEPISSIEYNKTIFKGQLFTLLGDATRDNHLTLLELNQVLQEVSLEVANDLDETLRKHYASRQ